MAKLIQAAGTVLMVSVIVALAGCGESAKAPPPAAALTVGGSVSGLAGNGLLLQLNGANDLAVNVNGKFNFANVLAKGSSYTVTVKASPSSPVRQTCKVSQGSGSIASTPINNIVITCTTKSLAVGGTVSGLVGKGLVLQLNGANDLSIEKNGNFIFPDMRLPDGSDYHVAIKAAPARQACEIKPISAAFDTDTLNIVAVKCSKKGRHK